jgi:hypothetical protein
MVQGPSRVERELRRRRCKRDSAPASEDCRALRTSDPGKSWPQPVHDAVAAHTRILYGFVTCGDINYMQIALALTRVR